ncbi:MAG: hypothetical protein HYZ29_29865 [Myxococcales bacterium]|nr:hypothetical protein [Myxococcales bacterium]
MMRPSTLAIALTALGCVGCMDHQRHVESVPRAGFVQVGPPLRSTLRAYVMLWPTPDGLLAEARVQSNCPSRQLTLFQDVDVIEITAAKTRWVPAAGWALLGGTLLAVGDDTSGFAAASFGASALVVALPMLGERTKREHLGFRERAVPGPSVICDDRPLPEVTLTLRAGLTTVEAPTDLSGRARFAGVAWEQVRVAYVDDTAVPVFRAPALPPPP